MHRIGVISGKFKPPHKGHFSVISSIARDNDETHIFVSPIEMDGITGKAAVNILNHFFKDQPSVEIHLADASPVREAFEYVSFLGKTTEAKNTELTVYALESDMNRFATIEKVRGDIAQISKKITSRPEGISGSLMRKYKNDNDIANFNRGLPDSVDKKVVWKELTEDDSTGGYAVPADSFNLAATHDDPNMQPSPISTNLGGIPSQWNTYNPMSSWDFMTNPIIQMRRNPAEPTKKRHVKTFKEYLEEDSNK